MSKIVIARYSCKEGFIVPKGIDLEDKNSVKEWAIKYNTLYIILADGKEIEVEPIGWMDNIDYKYPEEEEIEDAKDYGVDEEEESQ